MIDVWTVNISLFLSGIGIIWLSIIAFQFFTGRPYWGEGSDSFVIPAAIMTAFPLFNIMCWICILMLYISGCVRYLLEVTREKAVERRYARINSSRRN